MTKPFAGLNDARVRRIAVASFGLTDDGVYRTRSEGRAIRTVAADQQHGPVDQFSVLDLLADVFGEDGSVGPCRVVMCRKQTEKGEDVLRRNAGPTCVNPASDARARPSCSGGDRERV